MSLTLSRTVLILAAGEARRFNGISKQLLHIKKENILDRIVRQCRNRDEVPCVVTYSDSDIDHYCKHKLYPIYYPESHKVTSDTFYNTRNLWNGRTIILLGDVIYSKSMMDLIFNEKKPIRVIGNTWEVFAITFDKTVHEKIKETLKLAIATHPGKLRTFYKLYCGFHPEEPEIEGQALEDDIFCYMNDWSRDVDTEQEYAAFMREVVNQNRLDESL